jgi:hypothetical protein
MRDAAREHARRVVLLTQAATILSTWPLWSVRVLPPNLPLIDLPLPAHVPLLLSLAVAWRWPARGALLHALVLALAALLDMTRLTAAPCSLAVLLLTLGLEKRDDGARLYLAALWGWAGLNKLLSPAFMAAPALALALPSWLPLRDHAAIGIALVEVTLGVLAMIPSMHRAVRIAAPLLHVGALVSLTLAGLNQGVWAWNAALAMCAWWLFQERAAHPMNQRDAGVALLFLALPSLYYVGLLHPAFAHQLYSDATPTTLTCRASGCINDLAMREGLDAFGVPVPPSVTTLRAYFLATCSPGDRWLARSHLRGAHYDAVIDQAECPAH